jgi:hypothetical protein
MAMLSDSTRRMSRDELSVRRDSHPDWTTAVERLPAVGEEVFCAEGYAEVVRVLGKTGDGSRLLELRVQGAKPHTFFAAASNVLVNPTQLAAS